VPMLNSDVHDIDGLQAVADALTTAAPATA
jgi:hypothetical protein